MSAWWNLNCLLQSKNQTLTQPPFRCKLWSTYTTLGVNHNQPFLCLCPCSLKTKRCMDPKQPLSDCSGFIFVYISNKLYSFLRVEVNAKTFTKLLSQIRFSDVASVAQEKPRRSTICERESERRRGRGEGGKRKREVTSHGIAYFRYDLKCPFIPQDRAWYYGQGHASHLTDDRLVFTCVITEPNEYK